MTHGNFLSSATSMHRGKIFAESKQLMLRRKRFRLLRSDVFVSQNLSVRQRSSKYVPMTRSLYSSNDFLHDFLSRQCHATYAMHWNWALNGYYRSLQETSRDFEHRRRIAITWGAFVFCAEMPSPLLGILCNSKWSHIPEACGPIGEWLFHGDSIWILWWCQQFAIENGDWFIVNIVKLTH